MIGLLTASDTFFFFFFELRNTQAHTCCVLHTHHVCEVTERLRGLFNGAK